MMIVLPWPDRRLSPNARLHWGARAKLAGEARRVGYVMAWAAPISDRAELREASNLRLTIRLSPPDKRRRDQDNLVASLKATLDGIASACRFDDSRIRQTVVDWAPPVAGGSVQVILEPMA